MISASFQQLGRILVSRMQACRILLLISSYADASSLGLIFVLITYISFYGATVSVSLEFVSTTVGKFCSICPKFG